VVNPGDLRADSVGGRRAGPALALDGAGRRRTEPPMRWRTPLVSFALTILLLGCGGSAGDMLETAQLEEIQNNPTHARELYAQIVREHPGTPAAATAQERLQALDASR
jgi:hypothetical protein